ncbi:MAG: non-ribosomal peptide synthetase, partial [Pseudoclavibacter sp.]
RAADPADRERSAHPAPGAHPAHPDAPSLPAHPDSPTHPTHPDPDAFTRAAARLRVTPFMLVHAATALALQRAGAGDDLVLASPVADRSVAGSEALVDCLTNTVAVRQRGVGRGTIADALGAACEAVLDALERQSTSFDEVQRALGGAPLSDVLVGAYHLDRATVSHGGMRCDSRPVATANAKAALTPTLVIGPDGARVLMEYDRAAFTAERAGAIATAIARLIAELVTRDPQTPVAALELTTPAERERLLGPAAGEAHDLPIEPFGAHFLRAAEISSDRPAVTVRGRTLSYREVAERSLAVARSIRDAGVGPGEVVAVFTDRGLDMITTHVGTLLSGAAYLAVDPASPADRIAALFAALPPALVITSGCEPALPGGLEAPVVRRGGQPNASHPDAAQPDAVEPDAVEPDAARPDAVGCSRGDSLADVHADIAAESANLPVDSLAYVIFTSGTTGTPKPVGVSHRGISKLIATQRLRLGSAGGKRVLSFATPTFDAAFWQLCGTLCDGGELVVMPDECRLPGPAFVEFIERERIDVVSVPPSVLGALPPEATLPARAQLIVGAERLPASLVRRWAPRHALVNAYGPSEATVNTTLHRCAPDETEPVPIGQIDPGARGYVVDTALRLCPDEFPGELLIGGDGVALGYLGDPAKTAGRFIADPFSSGRRCYRSGDRVARRAAAPGSAGELVFIGRDDDQVKVRGFRVEPGEIAAALESLPGVLQAAVVVRTSASGHQQLVGYVVPSSVPDPVGGTGAVLHRATGVAAVSGAVDEAGIRASLRGRLSAHLVPDRVVVIDSIPRTSSGKLDRRALPDPTATNADGRDAPLPSAGLPGDDVAVSSESEGNAAGSTATADPDVRVICDAFATALRVTDVHPDDDFFALGGSSLVAATLLRDIAGRTGRAPTFAELLASPTPRSLAGAVPRNDPLDVRLSLRSAPARDAPVHLVGWSFGGAAA